jgi:hypothetical protein
MTPSAADSAETSPTPATLKFSWRDYVLSGEFFGGVILGIVVTAIAYAQIYAADPDWGTALDVVTLGLAGTAGQVSGKTVVDWVSPYVPSTGAA